MFCDRVCGWKVKDTPQQQSLNHIAAKEKRKKNTSFIVYIMLASDSDSEKYYLFIQIEYGSEHIPVHIKVIFLGIKLDFIIFKRKSLLVKHWKYE